MVYHNEDGSITSNAAPRTLIGDNAIIAAKDAEIARLTAERDEARAQVTVSCVAMRDRCADMVEREGHSLHVAIRVLTPADASTALARRDAAMRNEGRRQVIDHIPEYKRRVEILAALEPEGGE